MLKTANKLVPMLLLLMLFSGSSVHAQTKVYQYDGKLPFVQMMLNMMVAMGILDRLPTNAAYGYGRPGFGGSSLSAYGNPLNRSPWLQTPWSSSAMDYSGVNSASPLWGSPSWGVLPVESYATNSYPAYGAQGLSPAWSSTDLNGWVNETWETSSWNPGARNKPEQPPATPASVPPLVQNFNYNVPADAGDARQQAPQQNMQTDRRGNNVNRSPLAKLVPPERSAQSQYRTSAPRNTSSKGSRQKPCITDFCGLKKPVLDGLWVAQNGEMLGVKNQRYLWSDSSSRYLTGQLKVQNEYLLASVDGHEKIMRFKYKLAGDHLLTLQPDGKIREFTRMRNNRYPAQRMDRQYSPVYGGQPGSGYDPGYRPGYEQGY